MNSVERSFIFLYKTIMDLIKRFDVVKELNNFIRLPKKIMNLHETLNKLFWFAVAIYVIYQVWSLYSNRRTRKAVTESDVAGGSSDSSTTVVEGDSWFPFRK
jgi:hypothetical protein